MAKELLTINQAAKRLGVAKKTIRRWESQGKITSKRTAGGHRRFDISKLEKQVGSSDDRRFSLFQVVIIVIVTIGITTFITSILLSDNAVEPVEVPTLEDLEALPADFDLRETPPTLQ